MNVTMFSSWQVRCGIADYAAQLVRALAARDDTRVEVVPFDRQAHPRRDYERWGRRMNAGDVAHIQHEYTFFGYLTPAHNHFAAFARQIARPIVITRHVSFDGPLQVPGRGPRHAAWRAKWWLYQTQLNPYARMLNKDTFDLARQIIVLTGRLKDHLVARGIAPEKVHVIPPGVPAVPRASRDEALRAAWGWSGKRVICQFGFVAPAKGHAIALRALAQLPEDYVLLIAGGARLPSQQAFVDGLMRDAVAMGLGTRVRVTGYLSEDEVARHIAASDTLIFPNTHADFSYSVVTALAHQSAPVIASDLYSHREIAARCTGLALFPSGDAAALARQIERVTREAGVREAMLAGQADYARAFGWDEIARRTREVYLAALA